MSPLTAFITVAGYLAMLFVISWFAGKRNNNAGFFVGGRQQPWFLVGIATIGTSISGVTFLSVPGMVATSGFAYLQLIMGFIVGLFVVAFLLVPLFYRLQLVSIYQYLNDRFGLSTYRSGAWFFFISKMLGASARFFLVCLTMQLLVCDPLGIPFGVNVAVTMFVVWLYTFRGGVKSVIWTDVIKSVCLVLSVVLCIVCIASALDLHGWTICQTIWDNDMSRTFYFDDVNDRRFFFKQFLAGVFSAIATCGLDQDIMQRNLSCKNWRESRKNMMLSNVLQFFVILLFLMLGVLLYLFASHVGLDSEGDKLFIRIATGGWLSPFIGVVFLIALIAAAFACAGSALTALTTSFTVDILAADQQDEAATARKRRVVHIVMACLMGLTIYVFNLLNNTSVIDAVYILASYTYGPILGLFAFGLCCRRKVRDRWVPLVAVAAPLLCYVLDRNSVEWFNGYHFSYEILILNALFTIIGLTLIVRGQSR